jgi:hypothetical protein
MQATARRLSVVSATSCARRRLIRDVRPTNLRPLMRPCFPRSTRGKLLCGTVALLIAWVITCIVMDRFRYADPTTAFTAITGRELPSGVTATRYQHEMTDNLFHTTHYWILRGDITSLRQVVHGTGFFESGDARHMLPDMKALFGLALGESDVVTGFEWELDRDRWYCIFRDEQTALYAH